MKLLTFRFGDELRPGVMTSPDELLDLSTVAGLPPDMRGILDMWESAQPQLLAAIESSSARTPLAAVELAAPVMPRKFFAIGLNYADHVAESNMATPTYPTVFTKATTSVTGPRDPIELPAVSTQLDYEGELGVVIGRRCRHVSYEHAADVIAGYTVVNDVTVRDWQFMSGQWSLGKSFDTHGPMGPTIVTADELIDPHKLRLRTWVNGELRQQSNTEQLIFDSFRIVEVLSQAVTLEPGDVIAMGTPSGVAAATEGLPWLVAGDVVRVEIDGIGAIENRVTAEVVDEHDVLDLDLPGVVVPGKLPTAR